MAMARTLSLAALTALHFTPPQLIHLAAESGCNAVGLRLLPAVPGGVAYRLMDDAAMLRATQAAMADTGVTVLDLEIIRIGAGFDVRDCLPMLDVGARLGAKHVLVAGDDPEPARLAERFAALCDVLRPYGLSADLEFMPWTPCKDLSAAKQVLAAAARPNAGILVDALHFARSGSRLEQLENIPLEWLHYAQICDGAVPGPTSIEGLLHDARCERLLPGEGGIDLGAMFSRLPPDLPVSIEIPNDRRAPQMGYGEWVRRARRAALAVLDTQHPSKP